MQSDQTAGLIGLFLILGFVGLILCLAIFIWGTIFRKAGYSFWMSLLMLIPLVNLIWLLIFALSTWPIERELQQARMGYTGGFPVGQPPPQ